MPSEPKSMEEITFSVRLNKTEGSTLEVFIRKHWLAKTLLNNSTLSLYLVLRYPELQLINTKPLIKKKLKGLLSELKKFKVHTVLVLDYKKRNDNQILRSCTKLIASDLDIDEAFKSMHQGIMSKIKNFVCKDYIALDAIIKHSIKIFEC